MTAAAIAEHVDQFQRRLMQDAMQEATRAYWLRRAETFEWARPQPGEFHGKATRKELSARWQELTAIAQACRARAEMALLEDVPEVDELLASSSPVDEVVTREAA